MRKRNKVVSLLLAGCMAAGLLAGCGSSGEAQVATADNATAASTSTGAADSAAPETAGEVDGQIIFARYPLETISMCRIWDGAG